MASNQYGLSRNIPLSVAGDVRRRSKFGCVVCRCAVYQYEHIDPEFKDARTHDPQRICLLCGGCHDRVTRRRLSKQTIKRKYAEVQASTEIKRPFEELDLATDSITIEMGPAKFQYVDELIQVNGKRLLAITPPKDGAAFPTLNGVFYDNEGRESFRISDNVWEGPTDAWDLTVVGRTLQVRMSANRVALDLTISPPSTIYVNRLDMFIDGCHILCDDQMIRVGQVRNGRWAYIGFGGFECLGAATGIRVLDTVGPVTFEGVGITGGVGVELRGTGVSLGVGAAQMTMHSLMVWAS